jgi:hypothetical protein
MQIKGISNLLPQAIIAIIVIIDLLCKLLLPIHQKVSVGI